MAYIEALGLTVPDNPLVIVEKSRKYGKRVESMLYRKIEDERHYYTTLESFKAMLDKWLNDTNMGNHCNMWVVYQTRIVDGVLVVNHLNAYGDVDRQVCTITLPEQL